MMFRVGDTVRRISGGNRTTPVGFEGVIRKLHRDPGGDWEYRFDNGAWGYHETLNVVRWELVSEALTGPVRTVTRREVVPGVWSGVEVRTNGDPATTRVRMDGNYTSDQLKAAAAVLLELAGALSDGE